MRPVACGSGDCLWIRQQRLHGTRRGRAGWCAASGQPPHASDKNSFLGPPPFPCMASVGRARAANKTFSSALRSSAGGEGSVAHPDRRRHRHPAAPRVRAVPPALGRQLRGPARPADDRGHDRDPGLRDHGQLVRGRRRRRLRVGAAGRVRAVRRRRRRRDGPAQARARCLHARLGVLDRPCRTGVPAQHERRRPLRAGRAPVGGLRPRGSRRQRDGRPAAPGRASSPPRRR